MKTWLSIFLSVGCLALSPITSLALILPERPAYNDYTNAVLMGTECGKGIAERKSALNDTNAYLPLTSAYQKFVTSVDASVSNMLTRYVDHEQVVSGVFTNSFVPMLTASSVWSRLYLPSIWTNGSVNYTFTAEPISSTNILTEQYRVLAYLRWTQGALTWTNSTSLSWTNAVHDWGSQPEGSWYYENMAQEYHYCPGFDYDPLELPYSFPSWWEPSITNGPSGDWFDPGSSVTVDDSLSGTPSTNTTTGGPLKTFSSHGTAQKFQNFYYIFYYGGQGRNYFFYDGRYQSYTNVLTRHDAAPVVRVPYIITGTVVTGDVYVSTTNTNRMRMSSVDMTSPSTNSYYWIGSSVLATNDIFASTNFPFAYSVSWPYYPHLADSEWAYDVSWGTSWNVNRDFQMAAKDVVFKWTFAYCRP